MNSHSSVWRRLSMALALATLLPASLASAPSESPDDSAKTLTAEAREVWEQRTTAVAAHYRGGTQVSPRTARSSRRGEMAHRPPHIQAHIVKNRYLAMLKNEAILSFMTNLPFILPRDIQIWIYLLFFSPATIPILWRQRGLLARALRKRRAMPSRAASGAVA